MKLPTLLAFFLLCSTFTSAADTRIDAAVDLHLGTHTPGGLPLQVPDRVTIAHQILTLLAKP